MKNINWKVFVILWIASVISVIAIVPYTLDLQSSVLDTAKFPVPLPVLIAIQTVQNAIIFAVIILIGMLLANRIGLGMPILDSMTRGESTSSQWRSILPVSIILGVVSAFLLIALDVYVFGPVMKVELGNKATELSSDIRPPAWKGFLASFYGGIAEEIQLRLLVMSLITWLGSFISKTSEGKPTKSVLWIANIMAALLFGLGHLPMTSILVPLTPLVITRTIVLNGLFGIVAGYLYWKRGLESAMVSHFSADIVLHVLFAL